MLALWVAAIAFAGAIDPDPIEGFPVTIQVVAPDGTPLPRAFIRHDEEGILHPVNRDDGQWRAEALYLPDGSIEHFHQGDVVRFTVGAPGYLGREIRYRVKGMKHVVPVALDPLGERNARRGRRRTDDASPTWLAMVASLEAASEHDWNAPDLREAAFAFTPATMAALADPDLADVQLVAAFSTHLLSQGPQHAGEADAWARIAAKNAGATLQGPDYVEMIDKTFKIRAVAANLAWQQAEADLLDKQTGRRQHDANAARRRAATVAGDWLDYAVAAGSVHEGFARALCVAAAVDPSFCR